MLQENRDLTGKRNNAKMVIGYDLGRQFSQVSYYAVGDADPCTVSPVAGTEQYNIPTVLCKRVGVSQWYYGKEALKNQGGRNSGRSSFGKGIAGRRGSR